MLNNVIDSLFVLFFLPFITRHLWPIRKCCYLKKNQQQNGEDVTILLLRDTVTASWRVYVRASFRIKYFLLNHHLESGLVFSLSSPNKNLVYNLLHMPAQNNHHWLIRLGAILSTEDINISHTIKSNGAGTILVKFQSHKANSRVYSLFSNCP